MRFAGDFQAGLPRMKYTVFHKPILIALALGLLVGLLVLTQYGESWDEQQFYKYADRALQAYSTWPSTGSITLTGNTYDNYGPAYVMLVALGARLLALFIPLATSDLRHLLYFLTYLIGIWAFFHLCRRWLSPNAAFGATLLLATQPLFWGHAFISPKDIPFLTFFLLSLLLGLGMVDAVQPVALDAVTPLVRRRLLVLTWVWLALFVGLIGATPLVHAWMRNMVSAAAAGHTNIISWIASDIHTANPEVYVQKYFVWFLRAQVIFLLFSSLSVLLIWRRVPSAFHFVFTIAPAALALGLTTSIRVLGPFAGLMVAGYAIWKWRMKALPWLLAYGVIASIAMYATWPYLWPDPAGHFAESVRVMSEYPWRGVVLFGGVMYAATEIPRAYLPVLLGIQLTEPVWFLFAAGFGITAYEALKGPAATRGLLIITLLWLVLPLVGLVATRSALYDNFRQVIFILPPVFIMAGVVFGRINRVSLQAAFIGLVILPGIVDGVRLHPYEYVYYNRFIGGVAGAFREYELDYWGTSYREAAAYLNDVAPANANIWAEGPAHLLQVYVRPDLKIYSTYEAERAEHYNYVVALTRYNLDLQSYPQAPIVYTIQRDSALLTVIKKP
jgi:hypothetical protein